MIKQTTGAVLCAAVLLAAVPALAAPKEMPQGKRDEMAMKHTKGRITAHNKEGKEANKNVDSLIDNRK